MGHGLCDSHLQRKRRLEHRAAGAPIAAAAVERFWARVDRHNDDGCWTWTARRDPDGYGQFRSMYEDHRAHRMAYRISVGPIPPGMVVMHSCDNPCCVNPAHLSTGTAADNNRDRAAKGRTSKGEAHYKRIDPSRGIRGESVNTAKLTESDVRVILDRQARGESDTVIAREYGLTTAAVRFIRIGRNWKHVPRPEAAS